VISAAVSPRILDPGGFGGSAFGGRPPDLRSGGRGGYYGENIVAPDMNKVVLTIIIKA